MITISLSCTLLGLQKILTGTPVEVLQDNYFSHFRHHYSGRLMANLGFTQESGNAILKEGIADLVSFGAPFIANPDLVERFKYNLPLSESQPGYVLCRGVQLLLIVVCYYFYLVPSSGPWLYGTR